MSLQRGHTGAMHMLVLGVIIQQCQIVAITAYLVCLICGRNCFLPSYSRISNIKFISFMKDRHCKFPMVLHMRKFVMEEGWVPKKLAAGDDEQSTKLPADEVLLHNLFQWDLIYFIVRRLQINTSNSGVEAAID